MKRPAHNYLKTEQALFNQFILKESQVESRLIILPFELKEIGSKVKLT